MMMIESLKEKRIRKDKAKVLQWRVSRPAIDNLLGETKRPYVSSTVQRQVQQAIIANVFVSESGGLKR